MARYTPEERRTARLVSWQKYKNAHKTERADHNKQYVKLPLVKERRLAQQRARYAAMRSTDQPAAFTPTTQ